MDVSTNSETDPRKVFVIHGRDEDNRQAMFDFLESLGLMPIPWSEAIAKTGRPSPYIAEAVKEALSLGRAVVVLFTPDDAVQLRRDLWKSGDGTDHEPVMYQPRPNVLIELGMALQALPDRTILVQLGECRSISDIEGLYVLRMDGSTEKRNELIELLEQCECEVKKPRGDRWIKAGSFTDFSDVSRAPDLTDGSDRNARGGGQQDELSKEQLCILLAIARSPEGSLELKDVESQCNLARERAQYRLNGLKGEGYVLFKLSRVNVSPDVWELDERGRAYLVERELI